uniref:Uncharacterized protein n=1 Tax=Anopheles maculatus TaxID=74869 RepID=A0A182SYY7_9DIPT
MRGRDAEWIIKTTLRLYLFAIFPTAHYGSLGYLSRIQLPGKKFRKPGAQNFLHNHFLDHTVSSNGGPKLYLTDRQRRTFDGSTGGLVFFEPFCLASPERSKLAGEKFHLRSGRFFVINFLPYLTCWFFYNQEACI